jgi:hypothetical protein
VYLEVVFVTASVRLRREGRLDERPGALLADLGAGRRYLKRLLVKNGSRSVLLQAREIDWIEWSPASMATTC